MSIRPETPVEIERDDAITEPEDVEEPVTFSPLDAEVEAPINAAVHSDDP